MAGVATSLAYFAHHKVQVFGVEPDTAKGMYLSLQVWNMLTFELELVLVYFDIKKFCNVVSSMMIFLGPIFWQEKGKTSQRFEPGTSSIWI